MSTERTVHLPPELLVTIFAYLDKLTLLRASCVSRSWRAASAHPSLWHSVRLARSVLSTRLEDAVMESMARHVTAFHELDVEGCSRFGPAAWRVVSRCASLRRLNAGHTAIEDDDLRLIAQQCHGLHALEVARCWEVTDAAMEAVFRHCAQLQYLDAGENAGLTLRIPLPASMPNLVHLHLRNCSGVDDSTLLPLIRACPHLAYLNVRGCWSVTDALIRALATSCPQLRRLDVRLCPSITANALLIALPSWPDVVYVKTPVLLHFDPDDEHVVLDLDEMDEGWVYMRFGLQNTHEDTGTVSWGDLDEL